jgi:hypothetical protein
MKTKLLALLFLVGSAAFAAPRVVVGVGLGPVGVGVGVGVAPAYGYYAPPAIVQATGDRVPITVPAGWVPDTTDVVTTAAAGVNRLRGSAAFEGIL